MSAPPPGTIGLTATSGPAGLLIRVGTRSKLNHTYIVMGDGETVFEARPSGAGYRPLMHYPHSVFRDDIPLTDKQRRDIVESTALLDGTPYNWVDIAALSFYLASGHRVSAGVQRRIEDDRHLICSQLCDRVYAEAGLRLFDDGRLPGAVMPRDLLTCMPVETKN